MDGKVTHDTQWQSVVNSTCSFETSGDKMMFEIQDFKVGDTVFVKADYRASGKIIAIIGLTAHVQTEMPVRPEYNPEIIRWRGWYPLSYLTKECPEQHSPDGEGHKKESEKVKIFRIGQVVWFVNVHPTGKYCGVSLGTVFGCDTDGQYIVKVPHQSTVYFPDLIFDNEEDAQNKWDSLKKHLNQKRTNPLGNRRRFKDGDRVVCKLYDEVVHGRIKEYEEKYNWYIVILDKAVKTYKEWYIHAECLSPEVEYKSIKKLFGKYDIYETEDGINITGHSPSDDKMIDISGDVIRVNGQTYLKTIGILSGKIF